MRLGRFGKWVLAAGLVLSGALAGAQEGAPPTGLSDEFASLASRAATIFIGQVISIDRRGGAVEITFNVEQLIAGGIGAQYTLREWAGLWPQGQYRYTVGQRSLVFLHGTSAAGFGSPVDGAEGVVPVLVRGANATELLDVRRLLAALLRTPGTPLATEANGAIQLTAALPLIAAALEKGTNRTLRPEPILRPVRVRGLQGQTGSPELPAGPSGPARMAVGVRDEAR